MTINLSISHWSGWLAASENASEKHSFSSSVAVSELPDVSVIPAMLRRRLNLLGRACASEVLKSESTASDLPIVYCSQHGDIERTLVVLEDLVQGQPVSPMHFSLAVHNAICGVLSIHKGNQANISTLSGGEQGVVPMLLEASGLIMEGAEQVLCIAADVVLPAVYRDEYSQPKRSYAISMLVSGNGDNKFSFRQVGAAEQQKYQDPIGLIGFLDSDELKMDVIHNGCVWRLERARKN